MAGKHWRITLSRRMEGQLAKRVGGKTTPGSGNQFHSKGDVVGTMFLFEHKLTLKKSYTLKAAELKAIEEKALRKGMVPCLMFEFPGLRTRYAIVPAHVIEELERSQS